MDQEELVDGLVGILPAPVEVVEVPLDEQIEQDRFIIKRLIAGESGEVIVDIFYDGIEVLVFGVFWDGPHTPKVKGKSLKRIAWTDLPQKAEEALGVLGTLVQKVRRLRAASFRRCEECGESNPPGWMHDVSICQSCAERCHGVVY